MAVNEAIKVVVRVKPKEGDNQGWGWELDDTNSRFTSADKSKCFSFREDPSNTAVVLPTSSTHEEVYKQGVTEEISGCLLRGSEVATLAYGFPGSGKSYSLFGTPGQSRVRTEARGIVARVGSHVLELIQDRSMKGHLFKLVVSFYHVFEDGRVADLLDSRKRAISVNKNDSNTSRNAYRLEGLTESVVSSATDLIHIIEKGVLMRNATGIKRDPSSGKLGLLPGGGGLSHISHAVFTLRVEHLSSEDSSTVSVGTFTAIDLAGSSIESFHTAEKEAVVASNITALHSILGSLSEGTSAHEICETAEKSVLTKLLGHCLNRESFLCLVATVSMEADQADRTAITLDAALRLQGVQLSPKAVLIESASADVWAKHKLVKTTMKSIQCKADIPPDDKVEVGHDGTLSVNGSVVADLSSSCEELCSTVRTAQSSIIKGGLLINVIPKQGVGKPFEPLSRQQPLKTLSPARLPGLPSQILGAKRPLPLGKLSMLPPPPALPGKNPLPLRFPPPAAQQTDGTTLSRLPTGEVSPETNSVCDNKGLGSVTAANQTTSIGIREEIVHEPRSSDNLLSVLPAFSGAVGGTSPSTLQVSIGKTSVGREEDNRGDLSCNNQSPPMPLDQGMGSNTSKPTNFEEPVDSGPSNPLAGRIPRAHEQQQPRAQRHDSHHHPQLDCHSTLQGVHPSDQPSGVHPSDQSSGVHPSDQSSAVHPSDQPSAVHPSDQPSAVYPSDQPSAVHPSDQPSAVHPSDQPSAVHPSDQPSGVHPSNQPSVVHPSNQTSGVHPSDQPTAVHPSDQPSGVHPSDQPSGVHPSDQPSGVHPSDQPSGVHPSDQPSAVHPSDQPSGVHPSDQPSGVHPSDQPTAVHPSDQPSAVHPSDQPSAVHPSEQCSGVHPSEQCSGVQSTEKVPVVVEASYLSAVDPSTSLSAKLAKIHLSPITGAGGPSPLDKQLISHNQDQHTDTDADGDGSLAVVGPQQTSLGMVSASDVPSSNTHTEAQLANVPQTNSPEATVVPSPSTTAVMSQAVTLPLGISPGITGVTSPPITSLPGTSITVQSPAVTSPAVSPSLVPLPAVTLSSVTSPTVTLPSATSPTVSTLCETSIALLNPSSLQNEPSNAAHVNTHPQASNMDRPSGNFQSGGSQTVSVSVGDAGQPSREFSIPLRPQQQALVQDPSVSVDTEMEGAPHQQNVPIDNSGLLPVSIPAYHQESLGPLPPMSLQQLHPVHTLHTRQQLPPSVESSRPVTNQPGPLPNRASDLRPIQPATVARLPPAGTRLAPIQPMAHNMGTSSVSSVPLEAYNVELSDSLSSLGTDSDDDDLRLSGSRTLGLPQNHRMSLGRPTLPPISSESGNTSSSAAGYSGPTSSRGYAGVEPPRYEQIASTSTAHRPGNTAVVQTTSQPDHTDHSQGGSYGQSSTGDVIGEYFRDPHQFASTAEIHTAAMEGVKPSVLKKMVFQYGVEYRDAGGRTPLMYAVLGNQPKMCEVLVQMGSNVDAKDSAGLTPLLWASYRARPHAMKVLLRHNADVQCTDPQGRTAYHWSMKTADTQCIKLLCKYAKNGVQNKTDNEGLSPLHWAVMCDQDSHIHIFLTSTQVDATCQDPNGRTALNYAILNFSPSAIKAVLDHAEEVVNLRDGKGRTALHYACAEGSTDCIRTLLTYKSCNLHCTDYQGTTPLHWGAAANQPEVLKLLLRRGSDRQQVDKRGMTAIGYAQQRGFSECVKILETYGLKRLPSSVSIASQFQIPSSSPHDVDEYGHVPLHRPQHRPLSSTPSDAHTLPSLSGLPLDRGTADGIDRISRPGSGFEHIHDSTGVDVLAGLRQDNGMDSFQSGSLRSLPQSVGSRRSSRFSEHREAVASQVRRGWLRMLCGSPNQSVQLPERMICGGRTNVVAPMSQNVS